MQRTRGQGGPRGRSGLKEEEENENKIKNRIRLSTVYSSFSLFIYLHLARYFQFYNEKLCKTKTEKQQKVYLIAKDN